jgi:K+-transporting ATPase A subunit
MLLWSALILFILWVLGVIGNVGVGIHMLLFIAIGCFIVGLMGRAGSSLADEAERKSVERGAALDRGKRDTAGELNR